MKSVYPQAASKPVLIEMSSHFWVAAVLAGAGGIHSPGLGRTPEHRERGMSRLPGGFHCRCSLRVWFRQYLK